jgi:transcriptional regulator with XRE-family HTH domain
MLDVRNIHFRLGLTQTELAAMLGISQTMLSYSEKGTRDLPSKANAKLRLMEEQLQDGELEHDDYLASEQAKRREETRQKVQTELTAMETKRAELVHALALMKMDHESYRNALTVMIPEWKLYKDLLTFGPELRKKYEPLVKKYVETDDDEVQQALLEAKIRILEVSIGEMRSVLVF